MFGSTELMTALNVSAVTTGLSTYSGGKALISSNVLPATGISSPEKTINFYMSSPFSGRTEFETYNYTINCRAPTFEESRTIAYNVLTEINRKSYTDYFIVCEVLGTIPPADSTDNYNTPVQAIITKR